MTSEPIIFRQAPLFAVHVQNEQFGHETHWNEYCDGAGLGYTRQRS